MAPAEPQKPISKQFASTLKLKRGVALLKNTKSQEIGNGDHLRAYSRQSENKPRLTLRKRYLIHAGRLG